MVPLRLDEKSCTLALRHTILFDGDQAVRTVACRSSLNLSGSPLEPNLCCSLSKRYGGRSDRKKTIRLKESKMGMINEFKAFAVRGNVIDMAVGIIIGAAFTKIVSSFVADVVTPPLGMLIGGVDFSDLSIVLKQAVGDSPAVTLSYGRFLQTVFDFSIVAFAIFLAVKGLNSLKRQEAAAPSAPPAPSKEETLLTEIRDALRAQNRP